MKKILASIALILACIFVFSACGASDDFEFIINEEVDFHGETIYFNSGWVSNYGISDGTEETESTGDSGSLYNDALGKHIKEFKEKYNVGSIVGQSVSEDLLLMSLLAGTNKNMFLDCGQATMYNYYKLNLLWALNDLENVDLNDSDIYGSKEFLESVTFNDGKTYGMKVMGAWNIESVGNGLMFYNENLVRQFAAEDPWELYKNKKWTFSNFSAYLDTVSNMALESPIYGLEIYQTPSTLFFSAIFANGGSIYKQQQDGVYKYSMLTDPRTVTAVKWAADICKKDNVTKERQGDQNFFQAGEATIFIGSDQIYSQTIYSTDNIYYVPFPVGSDVKDGENFYSSFMSGTRMMCVPADRDNEQAGNFMSLFFSDLKDFPLEQREMRNRRNSFFSDDSYTYFKASSTHINSTGTGYPLTKTQGSIVTQLNAIASGSTYTNALSAIANRVQSELDSSINKK